MQAIALQLGVVVLAGWIAAKAARRAGQSAAVGQMLVGLLLGPSLLGWIAPEGYALVFGSAPEPLAWLSRAGLLLLMFQIGLEFDFSHLALARNRRVALRVSAAALVAPFAIGLAFGYATAPILSPGIEPFASALFVATAFSITALPILGRILIELGIQRTELGVVAISAAACIDAVGWVLLAGVSTLVSAGAGAPPPAGVFLVFAGFAAGVLLHGRRRFVARWNACAGPLLTLVFLPLYFTYTGLRTDAGSLHGAHAWAWCAAVFVVAVLGKFGATYVAARRAGLGHAESGALGAMLNTRGLVELVVLNVGYDLGVISQRMYTMLVLMAVASTVMTTPLLRRWLPRALGTKGRGSESEIPVSG